MEGKLEVAVVIGVCDWSNGTLAVCIHYTVKAFSKEHTVKVFLMLFSGL